MVLIKRCKTIPKRPSENPSLQYANIDGKKKTEICGHMTSGRQRVDHMEPDCNTKLQFLATLASVQRVKLYLFFAGFVQNIYRLQCYLVVKVIELVGGEGKQERRGEERRGEERRGI